MPNEDRRKKFARGKHGIYLYLIFKKKGKTEEARQ